MKTIDAMKQALAEAEAFTDPNGNMPAETGEFNDLKACIPSLRDAIAREKAQTVEPVGWCSNCQAKRQLRNCNSMDSETGDAYFDIVCNECHSVVASIDVFAPNSLTDARATIFKKLLEDSTAYVSESEGCLNDSDFELNGALSEAHANLKVITLPAAEKSISELFTRPARFCASVACTGITGAGVIRAQRMRLYFSSGCLMRPYRSSALKTR